MPALSSYLSAFTLGGSRHATLLNHKMPMKSMEKNIAIVGQGLTQCGLILRFIGLTILAPRTSQ